MVINSAIDHDTINVATSTGSDLIRSDEVYALTIVDQGSLANGISRTLAIDLILQALDIRARITYDKDLLIVIDACDDRIDHLAIGKSLHHFGDAGP